METGWLRIRPRLLERCLNFNGNPVTMKRSIQSQIFVFIFGALFIAELRVASAEPIQLSSELRSETQKRGDDLRNEFVAPATSFVADGIKEGDEIVVSGKYVGKGDQVLQLQDEAARVTYVVNFPRTMEIVAPNDQQIEVHGKIETIDRRNRKITIRGLQVDAPEAATHSH